MTEEMRRQIIRDAKLMSYGLIAKKHGLTRNQVAGVIWRSKNPPDTRIPSPNCNGGGNKIGGGYHGAGPYPRYTEHNTR